MGRVSRAVRLLGVALLAAVLGSLLLWIVSQPDTGRAPFIAFAQLALATIGAFLVWKDKIRPKTTLSADEVLDALAKAVSAQWQKAERDRGLREPLPVRWRRATVTVAGPVAGAVAEETRAAYPPLPGMATATAGDLVEGGLDDLQRLYGGIASGRLLVTGAPGSGKTSAAILLLLDAIRHREQAGQGDKVRIPVPVIMTLTGWDPATATAEQWAAGRLARDYPELFGGRAERRGAQQLLETGRIAVFLDGLDEIPARLRPLVLAALGHTGFRLVLLTRTSEAVRAAATSVLRGAAAVELCPIKPRDAALWLRTNLPEPAPQPWREVIGHFDPRRSAWQRIADRIVGDEPAGTLIRALNNPFTLSLLRDAYPQDADVDELLDATRFPDPDSIQDHLLDQIISTAYAPHPERRPRHTPAAARRTLHWLATRLAHDDTRDLAWWHLPNWMPSSFQIFVLPLLAGLAVATMVGVEAGFAAAIGGALMGMNSMMPRRIRFGDRGSLSALRRLMVGFVTGLMVGFVAGFTAARLAGFATGIEAQVIVGIASGITLGLVIGFAASFVAGTTKDSHAAEPHEPQQLWHQDKNVVIAIGLTVTLAYGIMAAVIVTLASIFTVSLNGESVTHAVGAPGIGAGFSVLCMVGLTGTAVVPTAFAQLYFALTAGTPLRLLRFMEDARQRGLLRTVGPVYQFRHARLQDHLAKSAPASLVSSPRLSNTAS